MNNFDKKDIAPVVIDLGAARRGEINESFLAQFGNAVQMVLGRMFGAYETPISVRGTEREIENFGNVLSREKTYMDAFNRYGLGDERVLRDKHKLDKAIAEFEKATKIKWPIK